MNYLVYIDNPARGYSHMICENIDYLHAFANSLGIKRCWYENKRGKNRPHYDVKKSLVDEAIKQGAILIQRRATVQILNHYFS